MKITNIMLIALLSTSTILAGFEEAIGETGKAAENVTDAVKGQTRAENSHLSANNNQRNSDVKQNGLVNINRNGSISVESGTNISGATIKTKNVQRNSDVKQNGLKNINENGSVVIGKNH